MQLHADLKLSNLLVHSAGVRVIEEERDGPELLVQHLGRAGGKMVGLLYRWKFLLLSRW